MVVSVYPKQHVPHCVLLIMSAEAALLHMFFAWGATQVSSNVCCTTHGELTVLMMNVQAGRPKTISGFQTHTTPVLLSVGERAELATQKYLAINPVLEGIVILQENPQYIDSQE